jgi:hypothetical protein
MMIAALIHLLKRGSFSDTGKIVQADSRSMMVSESEPSDNMADSGWSCEK